MGRTVRGALSDVIKGKNIEMSEKDLEDSAMTKALEKWYMIFATGPESWPSDFDLRAAVRNHKLDDMKLLFGNRSHGTFSDEDLASCSLPSGTACFRQRSQEQWP